MKIAVISNGFTSSQELVAIDSLSGRKRVLFSTSPCHWQGDESFDNFEVVVELKKGEALVRVSYSFSNHLCVTDCDAEILYSPLTEKAMCPIGAVALSNGEHSPYIIKTTCDWLKAVACGEKMVTIPSKGVVTLGDFEGFRWEGEPQFQERGTFLKWKREERDWKRSLS